MSHLGSAWFISAGVQRRPVSSSNLAEIGYERSTGTLEILFKNGRLYQYDGVPEAVFNGLLAAASHGTYFNDRIKDHYPFRRL